MQSSSRPATTSPYPRQSRVSQRVRLASLHGKQIHLRFALRVKKENASVFPSGDHTGEESCPLCVNCIAAPPAVEVTQILLTPRFASMSGVETVYATHLPSRDTCGSAMR